MLSAASELLESVEEHLRARREELLRSTQALLESVEARLETIRQDHELRRLRGENFNVFRVLHMEDNEEKLHSRFIAELLNPRGSHDQGDAFLLFFLEQLGDLVWKDESRRIAAKEWIKTGNATVEPEKLIGNGNVTIVKDDPESSTGGRIDIFLTDGEHHLSIENKIRSGEGEMQVARYCNYKLDKNFVLFLTLQGDKADTAKKNYRPISYSEHILPWLESCWRHAVDFPILRETIKQYIITVKRLTGGLTMDSQIRDTMKRHYKAAFEIRHTFDALVSEQVQDLVQQVQKQIEPQAKQQGWDMRRLQKCPGLVLSHEQSWGETQVYWEYDWVAIKVPAESPGTQKWDKSRVDVNMEFPWLNRKEAGLPYWAYVPKERFNTAEGIEHLFNESKRRELAEDLRKKLVALAEYCDKTLPQRLA